MKSHIFKGSCTALITPMDSSGNIDYDRLEKLLEEQVTSGSDAVLVCGTTGESASLSDQEQMEIIRFSNGILRKRIPLIAGAGSNCTSHAQKLCRNAEAAGADALLVVTPYYNKCTQNGLFYHYKACSEWTKLPFILYNIPGRTGMNILPSTYERLLEIPNVSAVKEASGDISQIAEIFAKYGEDLDIYSGNDDQIVPVLALGGKGVISVLANICPKEVHEMCQAYLNGDIKTSRSLQLKYMELIKALFLNVNPIPIKTAMAMIGKETGDCRLPLDKMEERAKEILRQTLIRYDLLKNDKDS